MDAARTWKPTVMDPENSGREGRPEEPPPPRWDVQAAERVGGHEDVHVVILG